MTARRISNLMNRNHQDFDDVLGSLSFSLTAEDDVGGLDEALEKFAHKKAMSLRSRRRGPIQGIPDDDLEPVRFEVAEDIAALSEKFISGPEVNNISTQPHSLPPQTSEMSIYWRPKPRYRLKSEPSSLSNGIDQQGGHNINRLPDSKDRRFRFWVGSKRRRTSSLPTSSDYRQQRSPVYLSPSDIFSYLQRPFRRSRNMIDSTAVSLPDVRGERGSMLFKCWVPSHLAYSEGLSDIDRIKKKELQESRRSQSNASENEFAVAIDDVMVKERPPSEVATTNQSVLFNRLTDQSTSVLEKSSGVNIPPPPTPPLTASVSEIGGPESRLPQCPEPVRKKKSKQKLSFMRLWGLGSFLAVLLSVCWALSVSPFLWGAMVGGFATYCTIRIYQVVVTFLYSTSSSDSSCCFTSVNPEAMCCSLHNAILSSWRPPYAGPLVLPQLRDLQAPPVPHLADEDIRSGPSSGPLGESLGYKLDKFSRPVYKAWMNEIIFYSPETYHINNTHSVYVTLEGTQLRIQRPRKNVSRRAMFNLPVPPTCGVHFVHQRIFDMRKVNVSLLPHGLVEKRLWSKKYPICLTVQSERKVSRVKSEEFSGASGIPDSTQFRERQPPQPNPQTPSNLSSSTVVDNGISPKVSQSDIHRSVSFTDPSDGAAMESRYTISTSRFLRVATTGTTENQSVEAAASSTPLAPSSPPTDFLLVRHSDVDEKIYLFARTCREKEAWFRRLRYASLGRPMLTTAQQAFRCLLSPDPTLKMSNSGAFPTITSVHSLSSNPECDSTADNSTATTTASITTEDSGNQRPQPLSDEALQISYLRHMAKFMPASWLLRATQALQLNLNYVSCDSQVPWLNALIGRLFWDFLRHEYWAKRVQEKIQGKLKKLHLPYFVNELTVTNIEMGSELPVVRNAGKPFLDNHGLWIEAEIVYAGGFTVSLETNINLMKLRDKAARPLGHSTSPTPVLDSQNGPGFGSLDKNRSLGVPNTSEDAALRTMAAFMSDEEDSADSSTDSDRESALTNALASILPAATQAPSVQSTHEGSPIDGSRPFSPSSHDEKSELLRPKRRLYRLVDRITRSSYFQKAVDSKFVQRGMEYVSNKAINLQLEVSMLHGTLVLNVPPPPSDRLWYGFRGNPNLRFKLKPKFGETLVTIPRFLEILEKKLILEFQASTFSPFNPNVYRP
ncbi:unnamed protein product [Mesocestoides corti]|uniref:SMP-LTD domain-containing protein n=1 Tax=Mesocestoides corti TaxID=53468 RepID=A0A0R3U9V3_MESCO|nr:unnamed protein product [Mesocestoides corti]